MLGIQKTEVVHTITNMEAGCFSLFKKGQLYYFALIDKEQIMFLHLNFNQNVIFDRHKIRVNFKHLKGFFFCRIYKSRVFVQCNKIDCKQSVSRHTMFSQKRFF